MAYAVHRVLKFMEAVGVYTLLAIVALILAPFAAIFGALNSYQAMRRRQFIRHDYGGDEAAYERDVWKDQA